MLSERVSGRADYRGESRWYVSRKHKRVEDANRPLVRVRTFIVTSRTTSRKHRFSMSAALIVDIVTCSSAISAANERAYGHGWWHTRAGQARSFRPARHAHKDSEQIAIHMLQEPIRFL